MTISNKLSADQISSIPDITVCVAVFNVKPYLSDCLDSLAQQSLINSEFIIVDDGSSDGSSEICDSYKERDSRFNIIHHTQNKGSLLARKTGIINANGRYIVFLDGDDRLSGADALQRLRDAIDTEKVDILRFPIECFSNGDVNTEYMQKLFHYTPIEAHNETLSVLRAIFDHRKITWSIFCHAVRADIAKKAACYCPDEKQIMAEDAFLTFIFISLSSSYKYVQIDPVYSYRVGTGISTSRVTLAKFDQISTQHRVADWLETFVINMNLGEEYIELTKKLRATLIQNTTNSFMDLPSEERPAAFDLFLRFGHHKAIYPAIQQRWVEKIDVRNIFSLKNIRLWLLGKFSFSRELRQRYRAELAESIANV